MINTGRAPRCLFDRISFWMAFLISALGASFESWSNVISLAVPEQNPAAQESDTNDKQSQPA